MIPHTDNLTDNNGTGSTVTGSVIITPSIIGPGVDISVDFEGLPDALLYGPFVYHIHDKPVPANGDCTATLGHFDPQNAGEYYPCIVTAPENCQVGDLAGKYGAIYASTSFATEYSDPFLSTMPGNVASVAGKSIVIHTANTTRITCANLYPVSMNGTMPTGTMPTGTAAPMPSATQSVVPAIGGAQAAGYSVAALLVAVAAFFL